MSLGWQAGAFVAVTVVVTVSIADMLLLLMMHAVPLLEADRQTLRSQWPYFQHASAYCADLACAHHNIGYQLTIWLLKHIFGQAHSVQLLPGDFYKNPAVCFTSKLAAN